MFPISANASLDGQAHTRTVHMDSTQLHAQLPKRARIDFQTGARLASAPWRAIHPQQEIRHILKEQAIKYSALGVAFWINGFTLTFLCGQLPRRLY